MLGPTHSPLQRAASEANRPQRAPPYATGPERSDIDVRVFNLWTSSDLALYWPREKQPSPARSTGLRGDRDRTAEGYSGFPGRDHGQAHGPRRTTDTGD